MDVDYDLTADDLYAFQWRAAFTSPIGKRARRRTYAAWFIALLLFAILPAIGADGFSVSRVSFTFLLVAYPIVALGQWILEKWLIRRAILQLLKREKPGKGQLGRHRIVLSDDVIIESTAVGESRTAWAGVDRVEQNDQYIFIYTSPTSAHVIPRRAFRDSQAADDFYQASRLHQERADDCRS
jgi:hypothetical protein